MRPVLKGLKMESLVLNRKALPSGQLLECRLAFNQAKELEIYDVIAPYKFYEGDTAVTVGDVTNFLSEAPQGDLTVRINSSGGEVGSALAIYNRLLEHPGKVTTVVDGYAFSSAGWLALAGSDRQICNGGLFMMHNPYMYARIDSLKEVANAQARWESHRDSIVDIFTARTPVARETIINMMEAETYLSASESVDKGFFHSVRNVRPDTAMLNCLSIPETVKDKYTADNTEMDTMWLQLRMRNIKSKFLK